MSSNLTPQSALSSPVDHIDLTKWNPMVDSCTIDESTLAEHTITEASKPTPMPITLTEQNIL